MPERWWIEQIIREMISQKADSYEVATANHNVDRLERTVRELSSEIDELRSRCEVLQETQERQLTELLEEKAKHVSY